jgi:hypothetical protein
VVVSEKECKDKKSHWEVVDWDSQQPRVQAFNVKSNL